MARKAKFYKGQIIRRKLHDGTPVGPYMRIMHIEQDRVYADVIGTDTPNVMLLKDNVYTYSIFSITISESLLNKLNSGKTVCAQHSVDIRWESVYNNPPELIRFITQRKGYESIFVVENVQKQIQLREFVIRIIVSNRVV